MIDKGAREKIRSGRVKITVYNFGLEMWREVQVIKEAR